MNSWYGVGGPPCSTFLPKENQEKLGLQQSSISPTYQSNEKKPEVEENIMPLKQENSNNAASGLKEKLPSTPLKSVVDTGSLDGTSIDGGKNLLLDTVSVTQKIPKALVPDDLAKVVTPEVKCEERSSEDELEKGLTRTLAGPTTADYCFSLKRPSNDSKATDSPWRYVPVVKRVSVSHGKPVPVESALMRSHIESEACLNLPRITDSLHDELKGGESDDGCRSNFPTSMGTSHAASKRRLYSDEVLEYSSYSGSKKQEKIKQRIEKISRAPDSIEREFRQTRLELEKELRLQKSLSEECEDLGVDEPSTSDLFPEADLLLDPNPSPSYDQTMPDTPCAQTMDSSEPFSSSDFRSVDSSSSAEGVHETAGCSKTGNKSIQRKEKPVPARPRKYLLRHRTDKKKWISVRNHHGTLEYRKASKDEDQRKPPLPRSPRTSKGDVSGGPLNGSNTMSQTNMEMSTFTSSSGEDSLSQHSLSPIKATTHASPPTFSSDMTYSPPQDVASPKSHTSQAFDLSSTPSATQRTNITYSKKGQSYAKDYSNTGQKHSRVYQFLDYLCEQGDSRDSCDSWESSNSMEKESTSESSKCGRSYHGLKDAGSPSSSPEDDDDGKSIPDYQDPSANHTSFSNLLQISNSSKLSKEMEETVLEGMEDDNAILPSANGIECDDEEKGGPKRSPLEKSLRKQAMEKNAKKHVLDKIDLYPRVCLKKWKGKDSITCSRYALELENVSAMPTGSKHFTCVERPLLESESSVSSEPSSENSSKTSIEQNIAVGHLELSKSIVLGKDGEFSIQSDCPNQSSVLNSSRRSSLRGHVKKGCPCCNGSPEPKKSRVFKGDKISKKIHSSSKPCSKLHMTKKR
ncbi:hypothetical protein J437_LFUL016648 [Ladona fulva]|uniref:Uncharacterized protein n=1 Tax=Ladona fulva TaxID=123851 RepID=A0A8K0KP24_LADFU|nr:hypothetical protein J437_LFUL016648 [Ladona fulva]